MKNKSEVISFSYENHASAFDDRPVLYDDWWDYIMDESVSMHKGYVSFKLIIK